MYSLFMDSEETSNNVENFEPNNQVINTFQSSTNNEQSSVSVALAGLEIFNKGEFDTADTILPFYLRKSQAERMKQKNA